MLSIRTRKNRFCRKHCSGGGRGSRRNRGGHGSGGRGGLGRDNRGRDNRGRDNRGRDNRRRNNRTQNRPDNNRQSKGTKIKKRLLYVYKKINKAFEITKEQCRLYPYTKTLEPIEKFAAEMSRIKTEIKSINKAEGKCKNISH